MTLRLYGLSNCDTCRKAARALEAAGHEVQRIDIRAEADLETKLPDWLGRFGAGKLVNRRSTTWRNLDDAQKAAADGDDVVKLLRAHPALIRRPVIETGTDSYLGWTEDTQAALT